MATTQKQTDSGPNSGPNSGPDSGSDSDYDSEVLFTHDSLNAQEADDFTVVKFSENFLHQTPK